MCALRSVWRCVSALVVTCCAIIEPANATAAADEHGIAGIIGLEVDARDVRHRVVRVRETVPVPNTAGEVTLLFPKWIPGHHAPTGSIGQLAGLTFRGNGAPLPWRRDPVDAFAFHVTVPEGVSRLDIDFQYLAASGGEPSEAAVVREIIAIRWTSLILYPSRQSAQAIQVQASVKLPPEFQWATALPETAAGAGDVISFSPVSLETLLDSPLYAGAYVQRVDLDSASRPPVRLTMFSDEPGQLAATSAQLDLHRALVREADAVFGSRPFARYDFLVTLSEAFGISGLEHRQSSETFVSARYFADWQGTWDSRYLIAHEYVHAWNGKWRVPAGLRTPDFNTTLRTDLLWVYEGQTQYWAKVLTARSGLWTRQQALDDLAVIAARFDQLPAATWRPLLDSTRDPVINPGEDKSWSGWQREQDYYDEGALLWLDVDTLIRQRSHEQRSLEDFARSFFAADSADAPARTYDLPDVVAGLEQVVPYDWKRFFVDRVEAIGRWDPLAGIRRGGYELVYNESPGPTCLSADAREGQYCFTTSIGLIVNEEGVIQSVEWNGPAFRAGLSAGMKMLSVNGSPFTPERLTSAIVVARSSPAAIKITAKDGRHIDALEIDYHGGPRYPHLVRVPGHASSLDAILGSRAGRERD